MSQAELTQLKAAPAPTEPFDLITYIANRKIRGFCGTIDDQGAYLSNVYQENRSLAAHVTADYHGRFLIELIQNGNDIHPHDRADGEIEVLLDAGANPTLYVANRGGRFTDKNVNALCDIGMSSKPPGEAIGNKGLGFRSVHHITDTPEIYSQAEPISAKPSFDGFCFSFVNEADLDRMLPDPMHRALAAQDLPLFHVPRWLFEQPESVKSFVNRGFSTVIRLPLRDSAALKAVKDELTKLQSETAPMLLFLGRLERLTAKIVNSGIVGGDMEVLLQRKETRVKADRLEQSIVDLGPSGTFLLARRAIAESAMKQAIQSGVAAKQLHPSWAGWKGHGEVALAVRLDSGPVTPRLYTFLPMGKEAIAPFSGYLHGSFFPTSNRKALNTEIELNGLILVEATSLAAEVVAHLSCLKGSDFADSPNPFFNESTAARATVDFLVWQRVASLEADDNDKVSSSLSSAVAMKVATALFKKSFDDAPVIPCLGVWIEDSLVKPTDGVVAWQRAIVARRCQYALSTFNDEVIAKYGDKVGIAPIWTGLGAKRIKALSAFLASNMKRPQDQPTPTERAGIVAFVASDIPKGKKPALARWTSFYQDLVSFMGNDVASLAGYKILLCGDGSLRATTKQSMGEDEAKAPRRMRRKDAVIEASVFAPPARRGPTGLDTVIGSELSPPAALKPHFAFLEEALSWYDELASVRVALEGKLFDQFDSDTVLTRLSQVLVRDELKETRTSGLRWAFLIWRRAQESGRPIQLRAQHRFFAPTFDGNFIEARDAIFSSTWPDETQGKRLQQFLDLAPPECVDLKSVRSRRLASTSHRAFNKARRTDLWTAFLTELGVQRGLKPIEKIVGQTIAHELTSFRFCKALGMSDVAVADWAADIGATALGATNFYYNTKYVVKGSLWWMPGQGDYRHFSHECRELYAILIVDWIGRAELSCWDVEIHHHYAKSDTRQWPTPVASFIRTGSWIPVDEPSSEGPVRNHLAPKDVWLASLHGSERFPSFLRRPPLKLLHVLDRDQNAVKELVKRGQLRILNDPSTIIGQASFLAEQYKSGRVDRYHEREFVNLYHRTWGLIADRYGTTIANLSTIIPPSNVIGRRDGLNIVIPIGESSSISMLHVRDNGEETIPGLIEVTGGTIFDARSTDPAKIGRVFKAFYGKKVRLISDVRYELLVGETPISEITCEKTVTQICPWLRVMTAVSLEAMRDVELQRLPLDRSVVIARLERVGLYFASQITFRIDGNDIPSLDTSRRAFALKTIDSRATVVVLHEGNVTWNTIESSLQAICEAIEQPSLVSHLRLLARELAAIGEHVDSEPAGNFELDRLCQTLFLDKQAIDAARDALGAKLDRYIPWLRAIVHLANGDSALTAFDALEENETREIGKLRAALAPLITGLGLDTNTVLDACKHSFKVGELRDSLKLDFAKFNFSLMAAGEAPDVDPERHRIQLAHFFAERETAIIETLRRAFAPSLTAKIQTPEYARLRDLLRDPEPDPSWLLVHQDLPVSLLDTFLENWLEKGGVPPPNANTYKIPSLQSVRAANIPAVRKFAEAALPLVRTWCSQNSRTIPDLWQDGSSVDTKLRAVLDRAGAFDFLPLNEADLLEWLVQIAVWPEGMPHTLDRVALGITSTDVEVEQEKSRAERAAREAQARAVIFNGRNIDPLAVDWDAISEEVRVGLSRAALSVNIGSQAKLSPVGKPDPKQEKRDAKNRRGGTFQRAPQEKKDMIGRLGEIAVYHWLKARLPTQDIDKAWLSENATFSTGRSGKDGLGYDFEIMFRKQTWQIEVKASLNDPKRFEMGETEVRAARVAARQRSGLHYVIAYVSNVGNPGSIHIELLPNPMTDEGANVLEILGEGIRYGFRRE